MEYTTTETVGKSCFKKKCIYFFWEIPSGSGQRSHDLHIHSADNAGGGLPNAFQLRLPLATSGARDPIYVLSKCQVAIEQLEIKQQISVN